jgi:TPP-dependent 2-oxoacid decarboxylase
LLLLLPTSVHIYPSRHKSQIRPNISLGEALLLNLRDEGHTSLDTTMEDAVLDAVLSSIYSSKNPDILVDSFILQFDLKQLVRSLVNNLKFPLSAFSWEIFISWNTESC